MEKEKIITAPEGREINEVNIIDGRMIDDKCKEIKCEHCIEWNFGYGMCRSCELQGESYHIEKPAEDRNCPLYGIKKGGEE